MRTLSFDVGLRNLAWCELEYTSESSFRIISWHVESAVAEDTNVNETSIEVLVPSFVKLLHDHFWDIDLKFYDAILIESQPMGHGRSFGGTSFGGSPRNLKTKVLSHIIQSFFIEKNQDPSLIHFISPMLKLKDCTIPQKERSYKANKKYAIEKTAELIQDQQAELFVGAKRDDLADAFLQAFMVCKFVTNGSMKLEAGKVSKKKEIKKKTKDISTTKTTKENSKTQKKVSKKESKNNPEDATIEISDRAPETIIDPKENERPAKKRRVTKKQRTEAIAADFV